MSLAEQPTPSRDRAGRRQRKPAKTVTEVWLGSETEDHGNNTCARTGQRDPAGGVEGSDHGTVPTGGRSPEPKPAESLGAGLEAARTASGSAASQPSRSRRPTGGVAHPRHAGQARDEEQVHEERRTDEPPSSVRQAERDPESDPRAPRGERERAGRARDPGPTRPWQTSPTALRARLTHDRGDQGPGTAPMMGPRNRGSVTVDHGCLQARL